MGIVLTHKEMAHLYLSKNKIFENPWVICSVAGLSFFFAFLQMNIFNSLAQFLISYLAINNMKLGFLTYAYFLGLALFFIPAGIFLEKFSTKKTLLVGLFISIVLTFLFAYMTHYLTAWIIRFFLGAMQAIAILGSLRLCSTWSGNYVASLMGIVFTIGLLGGIVAQNIFNFFITNFGFKNTFFLDGLLGILIFILILILVSDPKNHDQKPTVNSNNNGDLISIFTNIQNWICAFYACLINIPVLILGVVWGALYLKNVHKLSDSQSLTIISIMYLGLLFGSPLFGFVSDKLQNRKKLMIIGAFISIVLTLLISLTNFHGILKILFLLLGITMGAQTLSYPLVASHNPPHVSSVAIGFISVIIMGVGALSQPIYGFITQQAHTYSAGFYVVIISSILSFLVSLFLKERR